MSDNAQIHEYRHVNGVDSISVPAGSETDLAYASEPDWELVPAKKAAAKSTGKSTKDSTKDDSADAA